MEKKKLSIIVLCRNMKDYLSPCLDSVLKQRYENIEIVLINDSTTDPSCRIMADYCRRYPGCVTMDVIDSDLMSGGARNRGLSLAKGEFVTFIDGDDWLEGEMYNTMMPYFDNADIDMAICDFNECLMRGKIIYRQMAILPEGIYTPSETGELFKNESYAWNAIFRRSLFEKIGFSFYEKTLYEDLAVHLVFAESRKIAYLPHPFCQHRKHSREITVTASSEQHCCIIKVVEQLVKDFNEKVNMKIWGGKINDLLIKYLFNYIHFLMLRGYVDITEEILKQCVDVFGRCGGWLPNEYKNNQLIASQLESPHNALVILKQHRNNKMMTFI